MSSLDKLSPDAARPGAWRDKPVGALRLAAVAVLTLGLAACFQPLYGPSVAGGRIPDHLAAIEVAPVIAAQGQERVTHQLRSELVFDLDGSGQPRPKQYRLTVAVAERIATPVIDSVSGRADSATLIANATYTLSTLDGTRVITSGTATSSASYDRHAQRFASVRAARDAEIRIAKLLSEQIRTRLAAALAASS
ncbi:MAG TPA: LPS assembly lipoprotein LptE [Beijerinckiaceae bacterium]|jgi:LPS-assembly lipoprotein